VRGSSVLDLANRVEAWDRVGRRRGSSAGLAYFAPALHARFENSLQPHWSVAIRLRGTLSGAPPQAPSAFPQSPTFMLKIRKRLDAHEPHELPCYGLTQKLHGRVTNPAYLCTRSTYAQTAARTVGYGPPGGRQPPAGAPAAHGYPLMLSARRSLK